MRSCGGWPDATVICAMETNTRMIQNLLSGGSQGAKELGVSIFPIILLFNVEPRSYVEFPNHLINDLFVYPW